MAAVWAGGSNNKKSLFWVRDKAIELREGAKSTGHGGGDFFFSSIRAMVMQKMLWEKKYLVCLGGEVRYWFLNLGSYEVFQGKFFSVATCAHYFRTFVCYC